MGSEQSFFGRDPVTDDEESETLTKHMPSLQEEIKLNPDEGAWYIFGGGVNKGDQAEGDTSNPEYVPQDPSMTPTLDNNGEAETPYKWLSYLSLVFMFLGHLASVVVFSLLLVPPRETVHVEDELIAMWYSLILWPIYTGGLLIAFTTFSQLYVDSQPQGSSGRWRFKNPLYQWEQLSTITGLWLFYAAGLIIVIVVGAQLGVYYEPNDTVALDFDTDKYNFLNYFLLFVSIMGGWLTFSFMCVYMSPDSTRTIAVTGTPGQNIVSFDYNRVTKSGRGVHVDD